MVNFIRPGASRSSSMLEGHTHMHTIIFLNVDIDLAEVLNRYAVIPES